MRQLRFKHHSFNHRLLQPAVSTTHSPQFGLHQTIVSDCFKLQFELHLQPAVRGGGSNPRVCMWHCALSYINPTWKSHCPAFLGQFWELDLHTLRWVSHGHAQCPTVSRCGSGFVLDMPGVSSKPQFHPQ